MATTTVNAVSTLPTRQRLLAHGRLFAPLLLLLAMLSVVFALQPAFFAGSGLVILGTQAVPVLLLALGQSMVMMVGGIDLSSASLAVFSAIIVATALPAFGYGAPVLVLLIGAAAGATVGFLSAYFQVPSFAITLGALGVWQALALLLSNATTVYVDQNAEAITWLVDWEIAGFPLSVFVAAGIAGELYLVLKFTATGRDIRATGLNEKAALLSGVATVRTKIIVFAISGACAAFAGTALTAQQGTATASGLGIGLLLPGIAAAVAGGVAITGGVGNPINVIVGALIITLIPIGTSAIGIDPRIQQIVYGVIVILAVMATIDRTPGRIIK
jgi:ribose transport system permease protein